jgi:hypothetical protein
MAANEEQRRRMLAMLLRIPPKNALQQQPAQQPSNWLSKPLPMEGRFGLLPIKEEVPGMGPSLFNKRSAALPGLLAGAVNAFTAPGRAANAQPGFNAKQEGADFALNFMGGGLLGSRMAPAPRGSIGMNAYHGSPHKFDAFDLNKIGTGEGAQAYGHGLYFAENPGVAKTYSTLGNQLAASAKGRVAKFNGDVDGAMADLSARAAKYRAGGEPRYAEALEEDLRILQGYKQTGQWPSGNVYHVDIPDEAIGKMLDWDKPLTAQQSQQVLKALGSVQPVALGGGYFGAVRVGPDGVGKRIAGIEYPSRAQAQEQINLMFKDRKGEDAYRLLSGILGGPEAASAALKNAGVPGLRYFDGNSRGASNGTRNFVLFDDKLAKITKRE